MKILEQIRSSKYYVIQIDPADPKGVSASCSVFRKQGEELDLDQQLEVQKLGELLSGIPRYSAIILVISGEQVLTRFSSTHSPTLFGEIEEDEFYIQKNQSKLGWMVESACRKAIIDDILQRLSLEKQFILDVSIGPGSLIDLEDLVQNECLFTEHFQFAFKDGSLNGIEEVQADRETQAGPIEDDKNGGVDVAGTFISLHGVLNLASLLDFFKEGPSLLSLLTEQNTQYRFFHKFRKSVIGALSALFLLLLTNFLLFSGIRNDLLVLKSSGENQLAKVIQIKKLQSQIKEYRKLALFQKSAPDETYSFYLEEIARIRPPGVWFNFLELHPSLKKPEKNKMIELDRSVILLKGEAKNPVSLNAFIGALKSRLWIEDIELLHYENSMEKLNADFELRIKKKK